MLLEGTGTPNISPRGTTAWLATQTSILTLPPLDFGSKITFVMEKEEKIPNKLLSYFSKEIKQNLDLQYVNITKRLGKIIIM